jgi:3-hydroxyisobutyrate dehydrogenase
MYTSDSLVSVKCTLSPEETARRLKMVTTLMQYTNIVAAAEAVAFAKYLNVDMKQFFHLVINAAGGSRMFNTLGVTMGQGITTGEAPQGTLRIDNIINDLSAIVQEARDLYTPLHLATEALNQYIFAQRRGWGGEAATSIIRVWEG